MMALESIVILDRFNKYPGRVERGSDDSKFAQPKVSMEKLRMRLFYLPDSESELGLFKKNLVQAIGN